MDTQYNRTYRLIHWLIALAFLLLLGTIFLRMTWMNKTHVANIMQEQLLLLGHEIPQADAIKVAKKIRAPMWNWHIYLGYLLTGLMVLRFMLAGTDRMKFQNPFAAGLGAKARFQRWTYIAFYVLVLISLVTGLLIEWGPREMKKPLETVHELGLYYLVAYMVLHLGGVYLAERGAQPGLISAMFARGGRSDANTAPTPREG